MKKHILFLVHGMGSYGKFEDGKWVQDTEGWFKEAEKSVRDVYDEFVKDDPKLGQGRPFEDWFVIETIEYDSILEHYRSDWEYQAKTWDAFNFDSGLAQSVTEFFKGNTSKAFLWTHLADVLLYTSPLLNQFIWQYVADQFLNALRKHHQTLQLGAWSVIAHSLGTAVTNSALQRLFAVAGQTPDIGAVLIPPQVVCMAANVARALASPAEAYNDLIAPTGGLRVQHYLSCSHTLDPFCRIRPFAPNTASWLDPKRYAALSDLSGYYLADEFIDWVQDWNDFDKFAAVIPHGFSHYLRQPRVVAQLWPRLMGRIPAQFPNLESTVRQANDKLVQETVSDHIRKQLEQEVRQRLDGALGAIALPTKKEDVAKALTKLLPKLKGFS
jgi:pimeloyl-ACP methyl ester carboxylesterase